MSKPSSSGRKRSGSISRATFLKGLAGCAIAVASGKVLFDLFRPALQSIPCRMLGPSMAAGHMLRDRSFPTASAPALDKTGVTIIGGGIAGLSAAWWLKKNGFSDFVLLELEREVGGNSSSGQNEISAYPWAAHYVPLANSESEYVRMLFEELGIIQGVDKQTGLAIYNDLYMCHDPEERLLRNGSFQEGLIPKRGLQDSERAEMSRFFDLMAKYRTSQGRDGKRAFAIPLDLSSQDSEFLELDKISMTDWMKKNNFTGKPLSWYVNYCCRDDYGSSADNVSAWAAIHYFAGRQGKAANAQMNSVVTWPSGNGFLTDKLKQQVKDHVRTNRAVMEVSERDGTYVTASFDPQNKSVFNTESEYVICAAPRFVAKHILAHDTQRSQKDFQNLIYTPWMVANISLKRVPEARGVGLAWDNVSYTSKSLGYVVATHQDITTRRNKPTVITYYYPLSDGDPQDQRRLLMERSKNDWSKMILSDLEKMHHGITSEVISIDLWPWGHGMISPSVGYIWGDTRKRMKESFGKIYFAHSDMSGISNFEEAQYHGVEAAKKILASVS